MNELIYDGPHIQALVRRGTSPYVLVTFNGRGFKANGTSIWAQPIVDKLDLNAVGFVTKAPSWFPGEDLAHACAAALPSLEPFAERIGYGYSQGGYAAIKASRVLGLTHTLAVSPQSSIDPADIVDERFNGFFDPDLNRAMRIGPQDAPRSLYLFYDPKLALDRAHADRIAAAIPDATRCPVPFTDHETIRAMLGSTHFPSFIAAVQAGRPEAIVSRMRRDSKVRKATMIDRALQSRRIERAAALFEAVPLDAERRGMVIARFAASVRRNACCPPHATPSARNRRIRCAMPYSR